MSKILSLSLFCLLLLIAGSCNKGSDTPANQFTINGIHDVNFNSSATSNILAISVVQGTGAQEHVALSVTGLPNGISADIQPNGGIPTFGSFVTFYQYNNGPGGGTYPVKIVGKSATSTMEYVVNIVVPANGFSFVLAFDTMDLVNDPPFNTMNVTQTSGNVEPVTFSLSDVPTQLSFTQAAPSGTPPFYSQVTFKEQQTLPVGYYKVKITGTSASSAQTKTMVIHAPLWKGFTIDGKQYRAHVEAHNGGIQLVDNIGDEPVEFLYSGGFWPSSDGTYHYNVGGNNTGPQVDISYRPVGSTEEYQTGAQSVINGLTLTIAGGKQSVTVSNITLEKLAGSGPATRTISVDANEK